MYTTNPARQNQSAQIPSTDSGAWPIDVSVSPEEFFNSNVSLATVCPETALMYAVVEDAFRCFQQQLDGDHPGSQRMAKEAEQWFFSNDAHGLFSFVTICTALELEPEFIRKRLKYLGLRPRRRPGLDRIDTTLKAIARSVLRTYGPFRPRRR